jgi:signal transduction histidine kinase
LYDAGWRSLVAVPMLREGHIVGSLTVRRKSPGNFDSDIIDLLEAFASQSVLALTNAQLYRELQEQSGALEVASRHKSEFLASMSHELRTPLNAVLGFSEVLLERMFGDLNEKQEDYLRDIHASGKHLLELLNEILDLSKVEAGQISYTIEQVSLAEVSDDVLPMLVPQFRRRGLTLDRGECHSGAVAVADRMKVEQILLNLLSNASKYTPENGRVVVSCDADARRALLTVSDSGPGIPVDKRESAFEPFVQLGRSLTTAHDGTGLGLSISRDLARAMGGDLRYSDAGSGATFVLELPRA